MPEVDAHPSLHPVDRAVEGNKNLVKPGEHSAPQYGDTPSPVSFPAVIMDHGCIAAKPTEVRAGNRAILLPSIEIVGSVGVDAVKPASKAAGAPPAKPASENAQEVYGRLLGRNVGYDGKAWQVFSVDAKAEKIVIAAQGAHCQEYDSVCQVNQGKELQVGQTYNVTLPDGSVADGWELVGFTDSTEKDLKFVKENASRLAVPLDRLRSENVPAFAAVERQAAQVNLRQLHSSTGHNPVDLKSLVSDPHSKLYLDYGPAGGNGHPFTKHSHSGHRLFLGSIEVPDEEPNGAHVQIPVVVHLPPEDVDAGGKWNRLRKDQAAKTLAEHMGAPGLFPATVMHHGMMVQEVVGAAGENLHSFLHQLSHQDVHNEEAYPNMEDRIAHLMDKIDPKVRIEIARAVAFSALLGDTDQHGMNYVVESTGPNPGDVRIARIDTDYAFSNSSQPQIDRERKNGEVINGVYRYFSEKEIPPEVHGQIEKLSAKLNASKKAREDFAGETGLALEQVDAIAARARTLIESHKFPRSLDHHSKSGEVKTAPERTADPDPVTARSAIEIQECANALLPRLHEALKEGETASPLTVAKLQQAASEYLQSNANSLGEPSRFYLELGDTAAVNYSSDQSGYSPVTLTQGKYFNDQTHEEVPADQVHTHVVIAKSADRQAIIHQVAKAAIQQFLPQSSLPGLTNTLDRVVNGAFGHPSHESSNHHEAHGLYATAEPHSRSLVPVRAVMKIWDVTSSGVENDGQREKIIDRVREKWADEIKRDRELLEAVRKDHPLTPAEQKQETELRREEGILKDLVLGREGSNRAAYDKAVSAAHQFFVEGEKEAARETEADREGGSRIGDHAARARNLFVYLGLLAKGAL